MAPVGSGWSLRPIAPDRMRTMRSAPKALWVDRTLSTATESVNPPIAVHWKIMDYLAGAEKSGGFESLTNRVRGNSFGSG
jgi:hypothetical protein